MNYPEWAEFVKKPSAIAIMPYAALEKPCPKCGEHKGYSITSDGYAYCLACTWGTATEFPFTDLTLEILKPDGTIDHDRTDKLYRMRK